MKQRLDLELVRRGLAKDETEARALIMAGRVQLEGRKLDKPGFMMGQEASLSVKAGRPYVSRAGEKLASVANILHLEFAGKVVVDVGSSTGGFTDFVLQNGARKCYCVDVGTGQLDWKLRTDPRVIVMEQTDVREARLPEEADVALIDVSFVSLKSVLRSTAGLLKPGGALVAMAKPQFEASRAIADRYHGVISDEPVRRQILDELNGWVSQHFVVLGEADSGVRGAEGNTEHFLLLRVK